jgi:hypothetical protein
MSANMLVGQFFSPLSYTLGWSGVARFFTSTGGGWEYPAFLAMASLVHVLAGDGAYALKLPRMRLLTSAA